MNQNSPIVLYTILLFSVTFATIYTKSPLLTGSIQFPHCLQTIPTIRIYCAGQHVKLETDPIGKKLLYNICKPRQLNQFYLLITQSIVPKIKESYGAMAQNNTIDYFMLPTGSPYKFYRLELLEEKKEKEAKSTYRWLIKELGLAERIPDETIIIYYDPLLVEVVAGGNEWSLPTIFIKENVLELAGSEQQLLELSNALLLKALDTDSLHLTHNEEIRQSAQRFVILPSVM